MYAPFWCTVSIDAVSIYRCVFRYLRVVGVVFGLPKKQRYFAPPDFGVCTRPPMFLFFSNAKKRASNVLSVPDVRTATCLDRCGPELSSRLAVVFSKRIPALSVYLPVSLSISPRLSLRLCLSLSLNIFMYTSNIYLCLSVLLPACRSACLSASLYVSLCITCLSAPPPLPPCASLSTTAHLGRTLSMPKARLMVGIGLRTVSKNVRLEVSRTRDGLPSRASMYRPATPGGFGPNKEQEVAGESFYFRRVLIVMALLLCDKTKGQGRDAEQPNHNNHTTKTQTPTPPIGVLSKDTFQDPRRRS